MEDKNAERKVNAVQHLESRQKLNFCYDEKRELYKIFRSQIEHEDHLVNQRLTWMLLSQAFLFAAYFSVLNTYLDPTKRVMDKNMLFLVLFLIPTGGITFVGDIPEDNETDGQTKAAPKIKSFFETFKLIFIKGIGSRTTAFGTPMVIFSMWSSLLLLQFIYLFLRMLAS